MKNRSIVLLFMVFVISAHAQIATFEKQFFYSNTPISGNGKSIKRTSDGGYIIAGDLFIFPVVPVLIKTNSNGDTLWTKHYNFGQSTAKDVITTSDGGYMMVGYDDVTGYPIFVAKTDMNGDTIWTEKFINPGSYCSANSVCQTSDGGYALTGGTGSAIPFFDCLILKMDANGDTLWSKRYGGNGINQVTGNSIKETSDGGLIVAGNYGVTGGSHAFLLRTNNVGDTLWTKEFAGPSQYAEANNVEQTSDGGFIITGAVKDGLNVTNIYVVKTDSSGNIIWSKKYGLIYGDFGSQTKQTSDGGYMICANLSGGCSMSGALLIKTDQNGDTLWTKSYCNANGNGYNNGFSFDFSSDGGYTFTGRTGVATGGNWGVWLIKTDSVGYTTCNSYSQTILYSPIGNMLFTNPMVITSGITPVSTSPPISSGCSIITPCSTVDIQQQTEKKELEIFPNPFMDQTTIQFSENFVNGKLILFNAQGQLIREINSISGNQITLNRDGLAPGLYFIRLENGNNSFNAKITIANN